MKFAEIANNCVARALHSLSNGAVLSSSGPRTNYKLVISSPRDD